MLFRDASLSGRGDSEEESALDNDGDAGSGPGRTWTAPEGHFSSVLLGEGQRQQGPRTFGCLQVTANVEARILSPGF